MPSILIVDDSAVDRRLIGGFLEQEAEYTLTYAANGAEALEQIEKRIPDLVLTDLQMPEMNGLELVAAIKEDYPLVPVVLITARGSEEIAAQALRLGAASYVPKRRVGDDLAQTVRHVLLASREDRSHSRLMHHLTSSESTFEITNDLALIRSLVRHLQQMLRCLPLGDETERLRVGLALEEAMKNAYYHGNLEIGSLVEHPDTSTYDELAAQRLREEPYSRRKIRVRAHVGRDEARFIITDDGPGFDHAQLPGVESLDDQDQSHTRGLMLIRAIMDEVRFNDAGNSITLIKRCVTPEGE